VCFEDVDCHDVSERPRLFAHDESRNLSIGFCVGIPVKVIGIPG
jgi:hypothetical protein